MVRDVILSQQLLNMWWLWILTQEMLWSSSSIKILINLVNWRKSSLQNPYPQILLLKLGSNCKSQKCLFSFMDSLSWWSFGNKGCLLGKHRTQRNPLPFMLERPLTGIPSIIGSKLEGLVSLVFLYTYPFFVKLSFSHNASVSFSPV